MYYDCDPYIWPPGLALIGSARFCVKVTQTFFVLIGYAKLDTGTGTRFYMLSWSIYIYAIT